MPSKAAVFLSALFLVAPLAGYGQTVIRTDFSAQWVRVTNNARGSGELPPNWTDNSNWANLTVRYQRLEEEGAPFLRMTVSELETGWGQLRHSMPRVAETAYYRLRVRARSGDELTASAGVRRNATPYNYLWQVSLAPVNRWQELTWYTRMSPADYDVGFYIAINGAGSFDLGAFLLEEMSEQQLLDEFTRNAEGLPKNLLRNTRFPLGLPAGWMLDRDSSDGDVVQSFNMYIFVPGHSPGKNCLL